MWIRNKVVVLITQLRYFMVPISLIFINFYLFLLLIDRKSEVNEKYIILGIMINIIT